jgi:hypothetical protein
MACAVTPSGRALNCAAARSACIRLGVSLRKPVGATEKRPRCAPKAHIDFSTTLLLGGIVTGTPLPLADLDKIHSLMRLLRTTPGSTFSDVAARLVASSQKSARQGGLLYLTRLTAASGGGPSRHRLHPDAKPWRGSSQPRWWGEHWSILSEGRLTPQDSVKQEKKRNRYRAGKLQGSQIKR